MKLIEKIYQAGIVGCGGAGFPTCAKYSGGGIETVLINGAECEPLLQTDRYLMRNRAEDIIAALDWIMEETKASRCVIALKKTYTREIASLSSAVRKLESKVEIHKLDAFFPAGDEQTIVYEVTGQVVPPGGIPLNVGCVVSNIATVCCIRDAMEDKPFTEKYITVTGEVRCPTIVRVPLGMPVDEVLKLAGGPVISDYVIVNGGPMMGKLIGREEAAETFVTKTMSGLIVLPPDCENARREGVSLKHMLNRARSACIQCNFCSQLCPRALLGHPLRPSRIMRRLSNCESLEAILDDTEVRNAALCCECGICEIYACPMGLQPRRVNAALKQELAKAGIRYERPQGTWEAAAEREGRKAPTLRVASRAGVGKYEELQIDGLRVPEPGSVGVVRLSLKQGIGVLSDPVVKDGDQVSEGQLLAACPEGRLGSCLHASIDGTVAVREGFIEITGKGGGSQWKR